MPSYVLTMPFRPALDGNAVPIAGAQAVLTLTGTTTLAPVYTTSALTVEAANPVVANASGRFGRVYLNDALTYRLRIFDVGADISSATPLEDFDPYDPSETGTAGTAAAQPNWTIATGAAGTSVVVTGTYPTQTITIPRGDTGLSGGGTGDLIAANNLSDVALAATARTNLGLAIGTNVQAFDADLTTIAANITAAGHALLDDATAAAQRTTLGLTTVATMADATAAEYRANTADRQLSTDQVWAAAEVVALTDAAAVVLDLSTGINFTLLTTAGVGGTRALANPTNPKVGQSGFIEITQDGTGSRAMTYGANWRFDGGTDPTLSTAAGTIDVLYYTVHSATRVHGTLRKALA